MKTWYIIDLFFKGNLEETHKFPSLPEAMAFYNSKVGAIKFGLVGWYITYPREVTVQS